MQPYVFFSLALYSLSLISFVGASEDLRGFTIDLIHRDSPLSPFYNSSLTPSQRIINAALRSNSRLNLVTHFLDESKSLESPLIPENGEFLMRFYIGTPPVERLVIADTGSDLIWVQCSPCVNCFPQNTPVFEPDKSSTFTGFQCDSQACTLIPPSQSQCGSLAQCIYFYQYGDKSFTAGVLASETISFGSEILFPNSIFGCGMYNNFTFLTSEKVTGLVGLGAGPLSLISQIGNEIGHKFSYCLLPFSSNSTSKLKFGSEAMVIGENIVSTPLISNPSFSTFYFLNLESIAIGQKTIETSQTNGSGNIIIDSGTVLTYLEPTFYYDFVASVQEAFGVELVQDLPSPFTFCFPHRESITYPNIVFQFRGASVALKPKNFLVKIQENNMLCLAMVPSKVSGISIFGNIAQIDFQVGYDLEGKKVSFAPADCTNV
ncbi:hypothetical protein VNO78_33616 [Psophocarpus tetragonolobus]|uniref:Peptidase A1 domain-containing protein n=1 Tax=Psophocarpus tetragonolobus TaxID=3891 RepID=A0AAN9RQU6_PSOTE